MKWTNKQNLSPPLFELLQSTMYSKDGADYTTTQILEPLQMSELKRRYGDQVTLDVSDRVESAFGEALHFFLERIGQKYPDKYITERRFFTEVHGKQFGGKIDLYFLEEKELRDYKFTGWYKFRGGVVPSDYVWQANINAYLMELNGFKVDKLSVEVVYRDWKYGEWEVQKRSAEAKGFQSQYPDAKAQVFMVQRKLKSEVEEFIYTQVKLREGEIQGADDASLPQCTPDERWARDEKYAVVKAGAARASKLFPVEEKEAAESMAKQKGSDYFVEYRPGNNIRCERYCDVSEFCKQYKKLKGETK